MRLLHVIFDLTIGLRRYGFYLGILLLLDNFAIFLVHGLKLFSLRGSL